MEEKKQENDVKQPGSKKKTRHSWKKGESGNPNGRPKKGDAWADIFAEALDARVIDCKLVVKAKDPNTGEYREVEKRIYLDAGKKKSIRYIIAIQEIAMAVSGDLDAIKDIQDRDRGKPVQGLDHTTKGEKVQQNIFNLINKDQEKIVNNLQSKADEI